MFCRIAQDPFGVNYVSTVSNHEKIPRCMYNVTPALSVEMSRFNSLKSLERLNMKQKYFLWATNKYKRLKCLLVCARSVFAVHKNAAF